MASRRAGPPKAEPATRAPKAEKTADSRFLRGRKYISRPPVFSTVEQTSMSNESTKDTPLHDDPDGDEEPSRPGSEDGAPADGVETVEDLDDLGSEVGVEGDVTINEEIAEDDLLG